MVECQLGSWFVLQSSNCSREIIFPFDQLVPDSIPTNIVRDSAEDEFSITLDEGDCEFLQEQVLGGGAAIPGNNDSGHNSSSFLR
jgi:hypothetical protein